MAFLADPRGAQRSRGAVGDQLQDSETEASECDESWPLALSSSFSGLSSLPSPLPSPLLPFQLRPSSHHVTTEKDRTSGPPASPLPLQAWATLRPGMALSGCKNGSEDGSMVWKLPEGLGPLLVGQVPAAMCQCTQISTLWIFTGGFFLISFSVQTPHVLWKQCPSDRTLVQKGTLHLIGLRKFNQTGIWGLGCGARGNPQTPKASPGETRKYISFAVELHFFPEG